ncbi:hypothetical protein B0H13DRAFT_772510 [Mycena leptocephala]|nr:hypothetical protein B0H13DRAFT_772510 [Mycena leptocephala]
MHPMRASLSVPIAVSLRRRAAASLVLLTNDLVFKHPSRTRFMLMRIRISSQVRLGTRAALSDRVYRVRPVPLLYLGLLPPHSPIRQPVSSRVERAKPRRLQSYQTALSSFCIAASANSTLASRISVHFSPSARPPDSPISSFWCTC